MIPRAMVLLGGQLTGVPPEFLFAVKPSLQPAVIALYGVSVVAALVVFLPWVRRDKIAAFWFAVMLLAAIPAATVVPLSKNLGFVAVGAYGLIASFMAALVHPAESVAGKVGLPDPGLDCLCAAVAGACSGSHRRKSPDG